MRKIETAEERAAAEAAYEEWVAKIRESGPNDEPDVFRAGWQAGRAYARQAEAARPYGGAARLLGCSHERACRTVEDCIGRIGHVP